MRLTASGGKLKSAAIGLSLATLLIIFIILSCTEEEPVELGFVAGLSGRAADPGIAGRNGAMLAVEERNGAGGVRGDRSLLDKRVKAIIGPMTSAMATATVPLANERRVPMVSPTVTTEELTGLDDQFLRVSSSTDKYSLEMARRLRGSEGLKTVSAISDRRNRAYTESWFGGFRREFEERGGGASGRSRPSAPLPTCIFCSWRGRRSDRGPKAF